MTYNYAVSYTIGDREGVFVKGTLGIRYPKPCNNSVLKIFVKNKLSTNAKKRLITIEKVEHISDEESFRRFGNKLLLPQRRR